MDENIHNEIKKEMEEISPFLSKKLARKKEAIQVDYFARMQSDVMKRLNIAEHNGNVKVLPIRRKINFRILLAAASLIGILLLAGIYFVVNNPSSELDLATLDREEIKSYLLNHAEELDDTQLENLPGALDANLLNLSEDDLKSVLDDYLYQVHEEQLN